MVRLWLGAALVAAWVATWFLVLARDGAFFWIAFVVAWSVTPLLLWGLPLLVSGLAPRPDPDAPLGAARLLLKVSCYVVAGAHAACSLVFVSDLGAGTGVEYVVVGFVGTAAVAFLSGRRVGR
ncbi:MAG TPA: hypothetical protein VEU29_04000 [Actinomycetota bacterium]|nr:hypothetical protein [Actinomycetota bacterium]